jgi:hypothetical protein
MNIPAATAKTPAELAREAMYTAEASATICKLCNAIIALDARLSSIETAARAPFDCSPTDPGLSHPCGCEPTTARYPCDPISSPPPLPFTTATEELWACLKLISDKQLCSVGMYCIDRSVWTQVERRVKLLFPDRTL